MRVEASHLIKRMRWYLKSKQNASIDRHENAEAVCRKWLKWAGWWRLDQKERYKLYNEFKQ